MFPHTIDAPCKWSSFSASSGTHTHEQCAPVICNSLPTTSDTFEVLFMYTVHVNHLAAMFSSAVRTTRGHPRSLSLSLLLRHQSSSAILCAHCWPPFVCNTNKCLWHTNADKCETYSERLIGSLESQHKHERTIHRQNPSTPSE